MLTSLALLLFAAVAVALLRKRRPDLLPGDLAAMCSDDSVLDEEIDAADVPPKLLALHLGYFHRDVPEDPPLDFGTRRTLRSGAVAVYLASSSAHLIETLCFRYPGRAPLCVVFRDRKLIVLVSGRPRHGGMCPNVTEEAEAVLRAVAASLQKIRSLRRRHCTPVPA